MRAVEFTTDRRARVVDRAVPEPGPGEVLVRVTSAGICGSDVAALRGVHPFRVPPLVTGHEGGGTVVEVGTGVDPAWTGRAVALEPQRACGDCSACAAALPHLCRHRVMLGMAQWPGTLAEFVTAPVGCLHPVAADVPGDLLALAEPLAVAAHALTLAPDPAGTRVAVLGGGPIGALLAHLAAAHGATDVAATDPRPSSRAACEAVGATVTADPTADDWHDALSGPGTFDVVYVAATAPGIVDDAVTLLRPRGTVVQVGLFSAPVTVDLTALQADEKTIVGSIVYTAADFAAAVTALERAHATLASLVTDSGGLDGAVNHLNAKIAGASDEIIKLLVRPGSTA
ncbi:MAG: alcohol dehydrogenase catalytic domain-containing protein [Pseudonocardia sediminis]